MAIVLWPIIVCQLILTGQYVFNIGICIRDRKFLSWEYDEVREDNSTILLFLSMLFINEEFDTECCAAAPRGACQVPAGKAAAAVERG